MKNKYFWVIIFLIIIIATFIWSCSSTVSPTPVMRDLTATEASISASSNNFGLKIFSEMIRQDNTQNVFISPLSISMALSMTYNGASSNTQEQIKSVLEYTGMTDDEINSGCKSLIELLTQLDRNVKLNIANSFWVRDGFSVKETFTASLRQYYFAEVFEEDFGASTVEKMNSWVSEKTNGKIKKIVETLPDYMMANIINAVYFFGEWKTAFESDKTIDMPFYSEQGTVNCKTMRNTEKYNYYEDEKLQAVDLPYGNGHYSMTVFLAKANSDLYNLTTLLNGGIYAETISKFTEQEVSIFLPKFRFSYEKQLNEVLKDLGMTDAFDEERADFSAMTESQRLFITEVLHKSFVDVNEKGTEAAAVTSVGFGATSVPEYKIFRADKPFVFIIRERNSNTILFAGTLATPVLED